LQPKLVVMLLVSVALGVVGQFFFKTGMKEIGCVEFGPGVILHFFHPKIFIGLCCYGLATVTWLVILSRAPLSLVYPFISIGYVLVVLIGKYMFHERVSGLQWFALLLICLGVFLYGAAAEQLKATQSLTEVAAAAAGHFPPEA